MATAGIKAAAYCLNFAPELALHYGGTPLAQLVEHLTLNQGVQSSSLWRCTKKPLC